MNPLADSSGADPHRRDQTRSVAAGPGVPPRLRVGCDQTHRYLVRQETALPGQ